uniref:J domain-containing protein n=1 Tax=viral metagenome TaxID=1070528 RepID=A0A6C0J0E4_9ZZZZ
MGNAESNVNISKEEYDKYNLYKEQQNYLKTLNQQQNINAEKINNNAEKYIDNEYRENTNVFLDQSYKHHNDINNINNNNTNYNNTNYNNINSNHYNKNNIKQSNGNNQSNIEKSYNVDMTKIDPFNLLQTHNNINIQNLKQKYKKLALIHHPDKGGNRNKFILLIDTIKEIDKLIEYKNNNKSHIDLKNNYKGQSDNRDTRINVNLKDFGKNFKLEKFNQVFDTTKSDNPNNRGYGDIMVPSSKTRDDIDVENSIGKYNKDKFNHNFNQYKNKHSNEVTKYKVPQANKLSSLSYTELGETSDDLSHSVNKTIYNDYKRAYENTVLINPNNINIKRYKDVNELEKDRDNIQITREQQLAIENEKKEQEKKEWRRMQQLKAMDNNIIEQFNRQNRLLLD